jgi:hypothetical protein
MITPASPTRLFTNFHVAERVPSANNCAPVPTSDRLASLQSDPRFADLCERVHP